MVPVGVAPLVEVTEPVAEPVAAALASDELVAFAEGLVDPVAVVVAE